MDQQNRRVVWVGDPALDTRVMNIRGPGGYAETRDPSLVRERQGRKAHWFVVRPLNPRESIIVDERTSHLRAMRTAIAYALVAVEMPGGASLVPQESVPRTDGTGGEQMAWSDGALDMLTRRFGKVCLEDIATVIREIDEAPGEAFASDVGVRFSLLPLSLAALVRNERLFAESHQIAPETQSSG